MDLRFMAIIMAFAIIMDIVGRMARKRAAERQPEEPPTEGWNVLQALAEADELPDKLLREALPPAGTRSEEAEQEPGLPEVARGAVPRPAQSASRLDVFSGPAPVVHEPVLPKPVVSERTVPDPFAIEPVTIVPTDRPAGARVDPRPWEPPVPDRAARPIEVRSRAPRAFDPETRIASGETDRSSHSLAAEIASPSRRSRSTDLGDRLGLTDANALRRVVVAREVLGPPLALRGDDGRSGGHRS